METLSFRPWALVPRPGIEPRPPSLGAGSCSRWTSREAPRTFPYTPGIVRSTRTEQTCSWLQLLGPGRLWRSAGRRRVQGRWAAPAPARPLLRQAPRLSSRFSPPAPSPFLSPCLSSSLTVAPASGAAEDLPGVLTLPADASWAFPGSS